MWIGPNRLLPPAAGVIRSHELDAPSFAPMNLERWKDADAVCCLAAMTAFNVERVPFASGDANPWREFSKRYRPMRLESGEWRSFVLDRKTVAGTGAGESWHVADYAVELVHEGWATGEIRLRGRDVVEMPSHLFNPDPVLLQARYLNRRRLRLAMDARPAFVHESLPPTVGRGRNHLVFNGRSWRAVSSTTDLCRHMAKGIDLPKPMATMALRLLPKDTSPGSPEAALAARAALCCLLHWNPKVGEARALASEIGYRPLAAALREAATQSASSQKTAQRFLSAFVREFSGLSKAAMSGVVFWREGPQVAHLFLEAHHLLAARDRDRFVKAYFGKGRHRLDCTDDAVRWTDEVFPLVESDKARSAFLDAVSMSTHPHVPDKDMRSVANCLHLIRFEAERCRGILVDFHVDLAVAKIDELAADPAKRNASLADDLRGQAEEIRKIPAARRAEAERRSEEWMNSFFAHEKRAARAAA